MNLKSFFLVGRMLISLVDPLCPELRLHIQRGSRMISGDAAAVLMTHCMAALLSATGSYCPL